MTTSSLAPLSAGTRFFGSKQHESFGVSWFGQTKCSGSLPKPPLKAQKKTGLYCGCGGLWGLRTKTSLRDALIGQNILPTTGLTKQFYALRYGHIKRPKSGGICFFRLYAGLPG